MRENIFEGLTVHGVCEPSGDLLLLMQRTLHLETLKLIYHLFVQEVSISGSFCIIS